MTVTQILGLALVPLAATLGGGTFAVWRTPSARLRSIVQHFAAGVVFAVVAGELLPEITKEHRPIGVAIGFALGVALMLGVKHFVDRKEEADAVSGNDYAGLLIATGIDFLLDGLLIGIGFAAGARVGVLLVVALTLELLFLGIALGATLTKVRTRVATLATIGGLSTLVIIGAALGVSLLAANGMALEIVLSFGAAALMYLVVEELLVEAHEIPETPLITVSFFVGFLALYLLELLL